MSFKGKNYEALDFNSAEPLKKDVNTGEMVVDSKYWKEICKDKEPTPEGPVTPAKPTNLKPGVIPGPSAGPTGPTGPNIPVPSDCGTAGYPSGDGGLRFYTKEDCDSIGGKLEGVECLRPGGESFTYDCRGLNEKQSPGSAPDVPVPKECGFVGQPSNNRQLRIYTRFECEQELGGTWLEWDYTLSDNINLGQCRRRDKNGLWSYDCRGLNSENTQNEILPPVPGENATPPTKLEFDNCVYYKTTLRVNPGDNFFTRLASESEFNKVVAYKKQQGTYNNWEFFGLTHAQFMRNIELQCSKELTKVTYDTMDDWWKYVGDKWSSPCPYDLETQVGARRYQVNELGLNLPVCKQWRVWAPNANRTSRGKLGAVIPAKDWNKAEVVDGKWIWQHGTTTPGEEAGTNVKQECPTGDTYKGNEEQRRAELIRYVGPGPHDPADCFLAEKAFVDYIEGIIKQRQEQFEGWLNAFGKNGVNFLLSKGLGALTGFLVSLIPGGIVFSKFIGDAVEGGVKMGMDQVWKKVEKENPEVNLNPEEFVKQHSKAPAYEDLALKQAGYPATDFTDTAVGYKIKSETWADRRITMINKRKALIQKLLDDESTWLDKFGYDITNPYHDTRSVHGGKHKKAPKMSASDKYITDAIKRMAYDFTVNVMRKAKANATGAVLTAPKGAGLTGAGHKPHAKFAEHLRKLKVSPEAYLEEARRKAKVAGLAWRLLGWSDDGTHKLQIPNEEGRLIHFGSAGMGDHILYTLMEDPTASAHRKSYLARATKIRGDWKKSPYSANSLAIAVLW